MKTKILLIALLSLILTTPIDAQTKEEIKAQQEQVKQKRKKLDQKSSKKARQEAKKLEKEGWKVTPGKLPIDKQLDNSYLKEEEIDDYGYPKYMTASFPVIGETYAAAKFQAIEMAKLELAGKMETEISALTDSDVANGALSADEAKSIQKTVTAAKSRIAKSFGRVITVVEIYRDKPNGNKEVSVTIAINYETALDAAKKAISKELEEKGDELHKKLEQLTSWQ